MAALLPTYQSPETGTTKDRTIFSQKEMYVSCTRRIWPKNILNAQQERIPTQLQLLKHNVGSQLFLQWVLRHKQQMKLKVKVRSKGCTALPVFAGEQGLDQ